MSQRNRLVLLVVSLFCYSSSYAAAKAVAAIDYKDPLFRSFLENFPKPEENFSDIFDDLDYDQKEIVYSIFQQAQQDFLDEQRIEPILVGGFEVPGWKITLPGGSTLLQPIIFKQETGASCGYHALYNAKTFYNLLHGKAGIEDLLETEDAQAQTTSLFDIHKPMGSWRSFVIERDPHPEHQGEWIEAEQLEDLREQFFPEIGESFTLVDSDGRFLNMKDAHWNSQDQELFWRSVRQQIAKKGMYVFFINNQLMRVTEEGEKPSSAHWLALVVVPDRATNKRRYYLFNSMPGYSLEKPYIANIVERLEAKPPVAPRRKIRVGAATAPISSVVRKTEQQLKATQLPSAKVLEQKKQPGVVHRSQLSTAREVALRADEQMAQELARQFEEEQRQFDREQEEHDLAIALSLQEK